MVSVSVSFSVTKYVHDLISFPSLSISHLRLRRARYDGFRPAGLEYRIGCCFRHSKLHVQFHLDCETFGGLENLEFNFPSANLLDLCSNIRVQFFCLRLWIAIVLAPESLLSNNEVVV